MTAEPANLKELFDQVDDEDSFLGFARSLLQEDLTASEGESFSEALEAAIAWAESSNFGSSQGLSAASPWKKAAAFLLAGTVVE